MPRDTRTGRNAPPGRWPKRVLTVRVLATRVAWLDAPFLWQGGRLAWSTPDGPFSPSSADLARAERSLKKIASYPVSAALALGDLEEWLREREARLEVAKRLSAAALPPDAPALPPLDGPGAAAWELLLAGEALAVNQPARAPSAVLRAAGRSEMELLGRIATSAGAPPAGRAMAAMALGAAEHGGRGREKGAGAASLEPWQRRCRQWGAATGMPADPGLVVMLLKESKGATLAQRTLLALAEPGRFFLDAAALRALLAAGAPPHAVAGLAEAAAEAAPLAQRILRAPFELHWQERRAGIKGLPEDVRQQRQGVVTELGALFETTARVTRDPEAVRLAAQLVGILIELPGPPDETVPALAVALRHVLALPPALIVPALRLLVEAHPHLWDPASLPRAATPTRPGLTGWLDDRWSRVKRLLSVLERSQDAAVAREALELQLHTVLGRTEWKEPWRYRVFLDVARETGLNDGWEATYLSEVLAAYPRPGVARQALQPVVEALRVMDRHLRAHFAGSVFEAVAGTRRGIIEGLPAAARFLPRLIEWDRSDEGRDCVCVELIEAAVVLSCAVPAEADEWMAWLLRRATARWQGKERGYEEVLALRIGIRLSAAAAEGDRGRFEAMMEAALRHRSNDDWYAMSRSIDALARFPALRRTLADFYPREPARCCRLLVRFGLAVRLPDSVLEPLRRLEESGRPDPGPSEGAWADLLLAAPELAAECAAFRRAMASLGESPDVPPGVRRALALPDRLARELAYLESRADADEGRRARAAALRERLAQPERLWAGIRGEVTERMLDAAREARMREAETAVVECFRARLAAAAGPLPPGLVLDEDLLNAALLTADIEQNRRLLRRLLRAHFEGDRDWREAHPANAAFLRTLRERGVDTAVWLSERPRRYRCEGAAGKRVRLHLERDPLRILQMGNYFDTCLRFGGGNAFSTVANAAELNKRVVYATDGARRVVGRKLIGIDAEGRLVGYFTYCSLEGEDSARELRAAVRDYLLRFARDCGLEILDYGTVPTLFAENWYDDGSVAWSDEGDDPLTRQPSSRPRHPQGVAPAGA